MSDTDLPADVRHFIQFAVPTMDALELLIFLARNPNRQWMATEIVNEIRPVVITMSAVKENLAMFQSHGLVSEMQLSCFQFRPTSPGLEEVANKVVDAYNRRPVTLIRTIYAASANRNIQAFADAFKIKKG